ncbi:TPA: phage tail protein, partial [Salmonella enterica]|nr:phage tail protein [Salmonella enterica]
MPIISGVLKDGAGQPIAGCTIQLKAMNTTSAVIMTTTARVGVSATAGAYRIEALPARYEVTLVVEGFPPQKAGFIDVYADSPDGTLNDFLIRPGADYLMPDVMKAFEVLSEQARVSAERAVTADADITAKVDGLDAKLTSSMQSLDQKSAESLSAIDTGRNSAIQAITQKQTEATG